MEVMLKNITITVIFSIFLIFLSFLIKMQNPTDFSSNSSFNVDNSLVLQPFILQDSEISYVESSISDMESVEVVTVYNSKVQEILNKAKAMTEIKWIPLNNMKDKDGRYTFIKGKTYIGIPYSMGPYQAVSAIDFASEIKNSSKVVGNDCSGFVSASWGVSRQTTLSLYNAIKNKSKIDGKSVIKISWGELKAGDALLKEDGSGKGHILLFRAIDTKNKDSIHVYEQNVGTIIPYEPIPVARENVRSKKTLISNGYYPIRMIF